MQRAREIIQQILAIHDGNKLLGKQDNIDEFVKLIYNYKHDIEENPQKKYIQPEDRNDNPHHHNNRLD